MYVVIYRKLYINFDLYLYWHLCYTPCLNSNEAKIIQIPVKHPFNSLFPGRSG